MIKNKKPYIEHLIMEIFGVKNMGNTKESFKKIQKFIKQCNLNSIKNIKHNFHPHGFTVVFILSESHIAFHSWPENDYLHIDLLSCKPILNKNKIKNLAKNIFDSNSVNIGEINYGNK